jgi:Protein of unknown function (DUF3999)
MTRRIISAMLLSSVIGFLALAAELPDKWRSWRYSRAVLGLSADSVGPAELSLPWEIYAHCQPGCEDVRIVNSSGEGVPYVAEDRRVPRNVEEHAARVIENSFVAGQYTQVVGDLGEGHASYDRVKVATSRPDFIVWAEVALSDDAKTWRVVEARAPIARFRSRTVDGTQTIPFQGLSSRYIRVRIADPSAQFPVSGIGVVHEESSQAAQTREVAAAFNEEKSTDPTESIWRTTLASLHQPISELQIATDTREFYRAVRISGSSDGQEWSYWGSGVVYRYAQGDQTRELLGVDFPEATGNKLVRVEVINGNDEALANLHLALKAVPRTLAFKQLAGQQYRLVYGNEKALEPQYDLGHYFDSGPTKPVYRILALGPEEETANYRDPRPFTERHPELLWCALAAAILLIGLTAIKALRSTGNPVPRT